MEYDWKGNVRELENLMKRAIIRIDGETITALDIPSRSKRTGDQAIDLSPESETSFKEYLKQITQQAEYRFLVDMLSRHHGNVKTVAELMDLDRKTIYRKIEDLGIDLSKYRDADPSP